MIEAVIYVLIGAFIGWNLPQPTWAKNVQERVVTMIRKPR
jgi:hypothetical protein